MDKIMDEIKQIVKDGYQRGYQKGYEDGVLNCRRERAKYTAEKLYDALRFIWDNTEDGGMPSKDVFSVFGTCNAYTLLKEYSAKEIIDKVEAYKEKKKSVLWAELRVGDMLIDKDDIDNNRHTEYIVTYVYQNSAEFDAITTDGMVYTEMQAVDMVKTGKRYEIHLKEVKDETVSD